MADWQQILEERLAEFGHRNWIVVADAAYPAHSAAGIATVVTGRDHIHVLKTLLARLAASRHVKPIVYTDRELEAIPETDAPGVTEYRQQLAALLAGHIAKTMPHEEIITLLDKAGQTFRVLILKTDLTIPYTSVFLQLGCGYWDEDAERRLRAH